MNNTLLLTKKNVAGLFIDLIAIAFIYFVPAISHLLKFPVYLLEPMRIMLILAIAHTHRRNAYLLAFTLPLFSFAVSGHPELWKMLLITGELALNVWLFFFISKKAGNFFVAMLSSILASKIIYYAVKFLLIQLLLVKTGLIATPVYIQLIMTVVFSAYIFLLYKPRSKAE